MISNGQNNDYFQFVYQAVGVGPVGLEVQIMPSAGGPSFSFNIIVGAGAVGSGAPSASVAAPNSTSSAINATLANPQNSS